MAPQLPPLARSDSKAKFFQRLGLSSQESSDNRLYEMMRVRPPYSNVQICESAVHNEILRIYREAMPETKTVYDKGHDTESFNEENWIIRWMLCKLDKCENDEFD
ncbi:hypothetical protein KCU62_g1376, partial [Aureobasidium sp. EXF-3399]